MCLTDSKILTAVVLVGLENFKKILLQKTKDSADLEEVSFSLVNFHFRHGESW